ALAPSDDASTDARTDAAWPIAHAALVRDLEPARQVVWGNEALPEDLRWAAVNLATNYMHMKWRLTPVPWGESPAEPDKLVARHLEYTAKLREGLNPPGWLLLHAQQQAGLP